MAITVDQYLNALDNRLVTTIAVFMITAFVAAIWLLFVSIELSNVSEKSKNRDKELGEQLETKSRYIKREYRLALAQLPTHQSTIDQLVGLVNDQAERITALESRLKSFAALERLGIASQLGDEMIARTDEQVTILEHEMQEKIDQLRATQRRTLEGMRVEMDQYRANMAGLAK